MPTGSTARPVSGLERVWLAAARLAPPFAIHLIAEWHGPLDIDRWRAAIAAATSPGMRLRLRGVLRGARWVVADEPVPVDVIELPWAGDDRAPWLAEPLPPTSAPVRVRLVPGRAHGIDGMYGTDGIPGADATYSTDGTHGTDPTVSRVVFSAHHAITDGRGLWTFLTDTLRALAGEAIDPPPAGPLTDTDLARRLGLTPLPALVDDAVPICPLPPGAPIRWRRRRLPPGPQVLPRLAAAFLATVDAPGPRRMGVPVDLRRYAPGLVSTANLTGVLHLDLPPAPTPAAIRQALDAGLADRTAARHPLAADAVRAFPLWLMASVARAVVRRHLRAQRFGTTVTLSHLGRHALQVASHPVRVAFVPPGAPGLPMFVGITADATGVEVTATGPLAEAAIERVLDRVASHWHASGAAISE